MAIVLPSLYRYFSKKEHLHRFVELGEVYFNSLSYFLSCEEAIRRDGTENLNIFRPREGLLITNVATGEKIKVHAQLNSIVNADRIFIYCMSRVFCSHLVRKFSACGCVKILRPDEFEQRLRDKIKNEFKTNAVLSRSVEYYDLKKQPGTRHACPDQITMAKPVDFSDEDEYRIAFTCDSNLFTVNNVQYSITSETPAQSSLNEYRVVRLGSLSGIVELYQGDHFK